MEPMPAGKPGLIEAAAAQLKHYAQRLDELSGVSRGLLPPTAFVGPGRAAHDDAFRAITQGAREAANLLLAEATLLTKEAAVLDQRQKDWHRRARAEHDRLAAEAKQRADAGRR